MARSGPLARLDSLLRREPAFAGLWSEAERLAGLNRRLARALPPALARQCRVAALVGGVAELHCANGSVAARLRSQARGLAAALSTPRQGVDSIRVRVRADWGRVARPPKAGIGGGGLAAWRELDARLPEGGLKAAVENLLRHQRRA